MVSVTDLRRLWLYNALGLDETSGATLSVADLEHMYSQTPGEIGSGGGSGSAAPTIFALKGFYYSTPGAYSSNMDPQDMSVNKVHLTPVRLPAGTFDQVIFRVHTGGTSSVLVGVYDLATLNLISQGTSGILSSNNSTASVMMPEFTLSQEKGLLIGFLPAGDVTTLPKLGRHGWPPVGDMPMTDDFAYTPAGSLTFMRPEGTLPAILPTTGMTANNGRVMARVRMKP